jgi:hypothetical protein
MVVEVVRLRQRGMCVPAREIDGDFGGGGSRRPGS